MTSMTRRGALSAVLALAAAPAAAQSQRYPTRFIKLLVGFAPGGAVDTVARVLAEEMGKGLGQRIVVENRAGASGNLASGELARPPGWLHPDARQWAAAGDEPVPDGRHARAA